MYLILKYLTLLFEQYSNKRIRMEEKQPVTQPWPRLLVLWSRLVAYRCGPEGHFEAICPKYTPCTGAPNQGANLINFIFNFIWLFSLFLHFMFGSILVYHTTHVKTLFHTSLDFDASKLQIIKLGRTKEMLRYNIGPSCFAAGAYWKNSNA